MVDAVDRREPVGKRGKSLSVPNENFSSLHLERAIGEVSSSSEIVEYLLETAVAPGNAIIAGHGPSGIFREALLKGSGGAARAELALRLVQLSRRSSAVSLFMAGTRAVPSYELGVRGCRRAPRHPRSICRIIAG